MNPSSRRWDDETKKAALWAGVVWLSFGYFGLHNGNAAWCGWGITALAMHLYRHKGFGGSVMVAAVFGTVAMLCATAVISIPTGNEAFSDDSGYYRCGTPLDLVFNHAERRWGFDSTNYPPSINLARSCSPQVHKLGVDAIGFSVPTGLFLAGAVSGRRKRRLAQPEGSGPHVSSV